ncbi:MAG: hypothetical protein NDI69_05980 [Bacteriovoracaceae bacterium]|nr:hypothetical protein [Bacteriovoracaceae bacterium]
MKTVIIVSKCLRVTKINLSESCYDFHFKGVYAGEVIKKVSLKGNHSLHLKKGEEYLMYVQIISFEQGILKGHLLKVKLLDECWDRS